jgi:tetratricopeptide (TPR) repeat protein
MRRAQNTTAPPGGGVTPFLQANQYSPATGPGTNYTRGMPALFVASLRARVSVALLPLGLFAFIHGSCAHRPVPAPNGPGLRFQIAASHVANVQFEDELVEARLVLQALPAASAERGPLRAKLARYLLQPLSRLEAEKIRHEASDLGSTDVFDRAFESLRDASNLYEPDELWGIPSAIAAEERDLLGRAARLVLALFSPRGAEAQSALALAVLVTIEPATQEWTDRFDRLLSWTDEAGFSAEGGPRRGLTAVDLLRSVLGDWPAPAVADRLSRLYIERQRNFSSILKKPLPGGEEARRALGDLLLAQGDEMQRTVPSVAATYLRCGRLDRAAAATAPLAEKPGDEAELRALISAALDPSASPDATLALARRFLPPVALLGGTATDNADLLVAFRVLQIGLLRSPNHTDTLLLSAEVAKLISAPFLAIRQLEEAEQVLERNKEASGDLLARISAELLDLYFLRLRLALDPERAALPPSEEVERMRQRSSDARRRFQGAEINVKDAQIDFELARSYVNSGMIERALPLFLRAQGEDPKSNPEITAEFANLILKRGDPKEASKILRDGLSAMRVAPQAGDTIGGVEGQSRLERLLGDALDIGGDRSGAEKAWRSSVAGWERLMIEHLHRKNYARSAEATFEIGRVLYVLGRHADGIQKFEEAIEQDGDRDQSYIDAIAFLVQNGELDAALGIYRRALSRPDRSVSEYVKVYASLWIMDLTRRTQKVADPTADVFLRTLDQRHPEIRPQRGAAWYRQLAAFAVGRIDYTRLLASANTTGRRAEVYFYRAMQLLADGQTDDAYVLWRKVLETHMVSFFEFEMASRYLRTGAPTVPPAQTPPSTETI